MKCFVIKVALKSYHLFCLRKYMFICNIRPQGKITAPQYTELDIK